MSAIETYLARPWLAHYQKGVPASVEVPPKSVAQAFDEATERAPDRPAVVFYGRSISFRELRDATDRFAAALAALGREERRARRPVPAQQPAIHHRLLRGAEMRRDRDADQPGLHQPRSALPARGQRRARHRLPGHPLREGGEIGRAARSGGRHQRQRVPARAEAAVWQENRGARQGPLAAGPAQEISRQAARGHDRSRDRPRGAALYRRHHRQPEGRDAHALQPGRGAGDGTGGVLEFRAGQGGDPRLPAVLPHLWPGRDHAERPVPGEPAGALHQPGYRGDPRSDGALPRHCVLRRADALRISEGPQGHEQDRLEALEAGAVGRRHAARVDHAGLGEAHRVEHHRGLWPVGDLRHQPCESAAPAEDRLVRLPDPRHASRGDRCRHAGVRAAGRDRRAGALRAERDAGLLEAAGGKRARVRREGRHSAGCAPATWCAWTTRATSIFTTAPRT